MAVALALLSGSALACASGRAAAPPPAPSLEVASAAAAEEGRPVAQDTTFVIGERVGLHSAILGEDRALLVYRPPPEDDTTRYPVVYLLDGEVHFHHVTGLIQFLMSQGLMPRVMVVGVVNVDRTRDFTPTRDAQFPTSGGAERFLAFLRRELIPAVEAHYTTARYRVLIGHSLGGLLAIDALNQAPDLFDAIIALSPSLFWGESLMQRQTEALLAAHPPADRTLYLTVGNEEPVMVAAARSYAEMLRARARPGIRWLFEEMEREDHGSVVHRGVYRGLELVFEGWAPPPGVDTLAALERHYQGLSARFHIPVRVPEQRLNAVGYRLMAGGKIDEAIAAFRRNVELHPDSPNAYDSLGEALEQKGDHEQAVHNYDLAVKHAAGNRDPRLQLFMTRLEAARARRAPPGK